ncbi:hypothetical protein [Kribbella sp. NPDC006257]|uniref:hypothetical protein n=1 Tax=Kribbella sp. NPDC006257 TaxID=3156738 RepID=UPI0033B68DD3
MTDELKRKFEQLVADAPPPSGVPSEGVLDRVRTVKRRRTATAGVLATAIVVAAVIAAGNLTKLNSAPAPLTNTPGPITVITAPPTTTPKPTIGGSVNTLPPVENSDHPPAGEPSSPNTSEPGPVKLNLTLETTLKNQVMTVQFREWGSMLVPLFGGKPLPADTQFTDLAVNYGWDWGDGSYDPPQGKNGSGITCDGATKRAQGDVSRSVPQTHHYTKPGTFTFEYRISYCGPNGLQTIRKTKQVRIDQPHDY